jgi:hypothetical protein
MFSFKMSELIDLLQKQHPKMTRKDLRKMLIDHIDFYLTTLTIHVELD